MTRFNDVDSGGTRGKGGRVRRNRESWRCIAAVKNTGANTDERREEEKRAMTDRRRSLGRGDLTENMESDRSVGAPVEVSERAKRNYGDESLFEIPL